MIKVLSGFPDGVLAVACEGEITKGDYQTVLVPAVQAALRTHPKVRLYYEIGAGVTGFDPGAMWEDFKLGFEHLTRWDRTVVVTDVDWIRMATQAFAFLMPGMVKVYHLNNKEEARKWISEEQAD